MLTKTLAISMVVGFDSDDGDGSFPAQAKHLSNVLENPESHPVGNQGGEVDNKALCKVAWVDNLFHMDKVDS